MSTIMRNKILKLSNIIISVSVIELEDKELSHVYSFENRTVYQIAYRPVCMSKNRQLAS